MKNLLMSVVFLGAALASPVCAADVVWVCTFAHTESVGNWIAPEIVIVFDEKAKAAAVVDGLIMSYAGDPIEAKIAKSSAASITFSWTFMAKDPGGHHAKMLYRMSVNKASMKASMVAQAMGYIGPYTLQGKCKVDKG